MDHQKSLDNEDWDQVMGHPSDLKDCRGRTVELSFGDYFSRDDDLIGRMVLKKP